MQPTSSYKLTFLTCFCILICLIASHSTTFSQDQGEPATNQLFLPLIVGNGVDPAVADDNGEVTKQEETDQLILYYRKAAKTSFANRAAQIATLSQVAGVELAYVREFTDNGQVLKLPSHLQLTDVETLAARLAALPEVAYAEPDKIMHYQLTPNDTRYNEQWHYFVPTTGNYGANLPQAWDITTGSANVVVAVLDTGILFNHPDLAGRTVAGYDFIGDVATANDGNGRDADPSDPGDWCNGNPSSWHGTHVAGTIGAKSNNGLGVAGINWQSKIQPVRVLGTCGGYDSDIADAIRWAAGLNVPGVPANATPAKVVNLSLGGTGSCSTTSQNAINAATAAGTVVVVAAGNENTNASNSSPGNCNGVITVAATIANGNRASYSNYGATVEISAPGSGVLSTLNTGTTTPATNSYAFYSGTSMATPHIAGIVSLMFSVNSSLTPAQILTILQSTVTPFPSGSSCTTALCGAGIVNAAAAVGAANGGWFAPPSSLSAVATNSSQINLTWIDNSSDETGFKIERCQGANCTTFAQVATVGANVTTYTNTGLTTNTIYQYRVRATKSGANSSYSNIASSTTLGTNCTLYSSTNVPVAIVDNSTVESTLSVPSSLTLTDVNIANLRILHTWDGDLVAQLVSPTGTTVQLFSAVGSSGDNFDNTRLDDAASTLISSGTAPFSGTYRPSGTLSSFNGQNATGTWRLRIQDTATQDTGTLTGWGLELCGASATPPTAPSGMSAVGVSATRIDVAWSDNSSNETGFRLYRSPTSSTSWSLVATLGANVTSYANTDSSLLCAESYRYRVRAYNSAGSSSYSNIASSQPRCTTDLLFSDGFEAGNLSAWTASANAGSMSVTAGAALVGNRGLRMSIASNTSTYLTDDSPNAEARYRVRFYLDPNSLAMDQSNMFIPFYGYQGTSTQVIRVDLRRYNGNYQLRSGLRLDSTTWKMSPYYTVSDAPHSIELDWQAATAAGANNGSLTLWLDGVQKPALTGIDNDTRRVDRARLGAIGVDTGTRGTFYLDDFVSHRSSYIGPATALAAITDAPDTELNSTAEAETVFAVVTTAVEPGTAATLAGTLDGPAVTVTTAPTTVSTAGVATLTTIDDDTLPDGYARVGDAFAVDFDTTDGTPLTQLADSYDIALTYEQLDATISLQGWNEELGIWELVPTTLDLEQHTLRATLHQPARLALMQQDSLDEYQLLLPVILH